MSKTARIALSTKGLQYANRISRNDFRFVSGSDELICDRFQAAFESPRIARLLMNDPTLDEFSLNFSDSRSFSLLRDLMVGSLIVIDEANIEIFEILIEDVENCGLSELIFNSLESGESLNVSNCISRQKRSLRHCVVCDRENDFISSHFSELDLDSIRSPDVDNFKTILRSDQN
jgi:hypothetical protein